VRRGDGAEKSSKPRMASGESSGIEDVSTDWQCRRAMLRRRN
jgi:hypothetical protein